VTDGSPTPGQPTAPSEIDTSVPHSARIWPPIGLGYDHSDTRKSVNNLAAVPREWRNYSYSSTFVSPTSGPTVAGFACRQRNWMIVAAHTSPTVPWPDNQISR
jgi:hypothetical protein